MQSTSGADPALRDLTQRMARGDDDAWQGFHREYGPGIFRHLLACTRGDHALASDALQGAYLRIARHVRITDNDAQWSAWLRIVARSALNDLRRRDSRFVAMLRRWWHEPVAHDDSEDDDTSLLDALDHCLGELDDDTRALLDAKYLRGESVNDIATRLRLSPKAIESRLTRARAELREKLEERLKRHE